MAAARISPHTMRWPALSREAASRQYRDSTFPKMTARDAEDYERDLGIALGRLHRSRILDVGCGFGVFGSECRRMGIDVVDLDPAYASRREVRARLSAYTIPSIAYNQRLSSTSETVSAARDSVAKIAGVHETLPFKDASFEVVVASYSSLFYVDYASNGAEARRAVKTMLGETIRVLCRGGRAFLMLKEESTAIRNRTIKQITDATEGCSWELTFPYGCPVLKLTKR